MDEENPYKFWLNVLGGLFAVVGGVIYLISTGIIVNGIMADVWTLLWHAFGGGLFWVGVVFIGLSLAVSAIRWVAPPRAATLTDLVSARPAEPPQTLTAQEIIDILAEARANRA